MSVVRLVRRGFAQKRFQSRAADATDEISYCIGDSFADVWALARARNAEFVLLVDEAVACTDRELQLLVRVLRANSSLDGVTMDSEALWPVYTVEPASRRASAVAWSTGKLPVLPSWLALLRAERWHGADGDTLTPEFFLFAHGERSVARTFSPRCDVDSVSWAGDLLLGSVAALAADYERAVARGGTDIPRQFRVSIPGQSGSNGRGLAPPLTRPPVISLLCPSIRPDFLREAVDSVVAQEWPHWELLVGLDGPKDTHLRTMTQILADYAADSRVRPFLLPHAGTGPTRRRLASEATGDFVMAMDDDDRLPPHALARFAAAIDAEPGAVALRGGTRVFGLLETYLPPRRRYLVGGIPNDIFEVNQPWLIRRNVLAALGGLEWDANLKNAGEDSDLFLKVDRAGAPVVLIDEPLYHRRLSTLNQTLDCTADECLEHVRTLYGRHAPHPWTLGGVSFRGQSMLLGMISEHRNPTDDTTIVCATRFMDFQKLGSRTDVVLDLEITSLCNALCTFCPREVLQRTARFMSLETVERVAASLQREGNNPLVMLCGIGESTLHPDLAEVITLLAGAGARVGMTTNGWSLSPPLLDELVAAGLSQINVSLNAHTATTHATVMRLTNFDQIVARVREIAGLRSHRWPPLRLNVSFVLTDANADEVGAFVECWRHSGVSQIWLHPLTNRAGSLSADCRPVDIRPLGARYAGDPMVLVDLFPDDPGSTNVCRVAQGVDFISVDGDMFLCAQDYSARHAFGNIAHGTLEDLHHAKLLRHVRGESADTCASCTFCPPEFKGGSAGLSAIVQAGGRGA